MIIGLIGSKGSGKDTLADYLVEYFGFVKRSFAYPLKAACKELFVLTDEQLNDNTLKETPDERWFGKTPREMLQFVGTDLFRNKMYKLMKELDKDIFTHNFKLWYEREIKLNPKLLVVVPDVRFHNEANLIKSLGGYNIRIFRPSLEKNIFSNHASETELENINNLDCIINNNVEGDLDFIYSQIYMFIKDKLI